ncbi:MAG: Crp/Fnr family transcriptional regulator [Flavobacterium sp.]|nr:MAG: Crp/Fnr family transcriptional regulator [Flavobacterium sp.]
MPNQLLHYISDYSGQSLSAAEAALIKSMFQVKKMRKRQFFLQAGDECTDVAFIVKGAMRQYRTSEKGTKSIVQLGIENWWVGDRSSFSLAQPSIYNIDAWEHTELNVISRKGVLQLIENSPAFAKMVRVMDERHAGATQERISGYNLLTADQRYASFSERYPELASRFPLHVIASYLGMTKETLSRIRAASKTGK